MSLALPESTTRRPEQREATDIGNLELPATAGMILQKKIRKRIDQERKSLNLTLLNKENLVNQGVGETAGKGRDQGLEREAEVRTETEETPTEDPTPAEVRDPILKEVVGRTTKEEFFNAKYTNAS